jgi:hypothetical protein
MVGTGATHRLHAASIVLDAMRFSETQRKRADDVFGLPLRSGKPVSSGSKGRTATRRPRAGRQSLIQMRTCSKTCAQFYPLDRNDPRFYGGVCELPVGDKMGWSVRTRGIY